MSPFTSLKDRFDDLPLVLAGPIVRRVQTKNISGTSNIPEETAGVSIWLVLKEKRNVGLTIHDHSSATPQKGALVNADPVQIGDNIFVVMLTSNQEFNYDEKYYYNLIFAPENFTGKVKDNTPGRFNLLDQGVLSNSTKLNQRKKIVCYTGEPFPFFLTPRSNINKVKVTHLSCRKPHGGDYETEEDSFNHLDKFMDENASGNGDNIPQQLFMTGDQIYADDVDVSLAFLIQDAIPVLYNEVYNPRDMHFNSLSKKSFELGQREKTVVKEAGFTHEDGHAQNHLIHESEYYLMYLFVWSDVLWPDYIPNYHEIIDYTCVKGRGFDKLDFDDYYFQKSTNAESSEYSDLFLNDPGYTTKGGGGFKLKNGLDSKLNHLKQFKKNLPAARRVLANISTYMMFDDHDITDDWNITQNWVRDIIGNSTWIDLGNSAGKELGKYIITNGLMAFTIFQGWGNKPVDYQKNNSSENNLLLDIGYYYNCISSGNKIHIQTKRSTLSGKLLSSFNPDDNSTYENLGGFCIYSTVDWHFHFDCGCYTVVILDTRTMRGFSSKTGAPALISSKGLSEQMPHQEFHQNKKCTFLISPAPVFGNEGVEELQHKKMYSHGIPAADYESWGYFKEALDAMCFSLIPAERLIILSGDVHYGFSHQIRVWNFTPPLSKPEDSIFSNWKNTLAPKNPLKPLDLKPKILKVAQLVSSSAKNSESITHAGTKGVYMIDELGANDKVDIIANSEPIDPDPKPVNRYSYNLYVTSVINGKKTVNCKAMKSKPRVVELPSDINNYHGQYDSNLFPARQYRVIHIVDPSPPISGWKDSVSDDDPDNDYLSAGFNSKITGLNNVGIVSISHNGDSVHHKLLFTEFAGKPVLELKHEINFATQINLPYTGHD